MKAPIVLSLAILFCLTLVTASTVSHAQELRDGTNDGVAALVEQLHDSVEEILWVTYWHSDDSPETNRSASVVTTGNMSQVKSCEVVVDWYAQGGQPEGSTMVTVPPREARDHCSRAVPGSVTVCNAVRVPVEFIEGYAIIKTERHCRRNIAADARVYHTTGDGDEILGAQNVEIVALPRGRR